MNRVEMKPDGPYHCTGALHVRAADGSALADVDETWLCACGASKDKPYCDGSHALTNFSNAQPGHPGDNPAGAFGAASPAASSERPGTPAVAPTAGVALTIRTRKDGPLKLTGPLEVISPDGAVLLRGEETALCRCGHSATKPFCDGTHRNIGFSA